MAWVVSMKMDENTCNPFLIYGLILFLTKNPNDRDF